MVKNIQQQQAKFMKECGQFVAPRPIGIVNIKRNSEIELYKNLIDEEDLELRLAIEQLNDCITGDAYPRETYAAMAEVCAEAVDNVYVIMGLMNTLGLPFHAMWDAIHEANLNKRINGVVTKDKNGKIIKPKDWQPVDKLAIINKAIQWGNK